MTDRRHRRGRHLARCHDHDHDHDTIDVLRVGAQELYEFLDGELTADKRGQIKGHLDDCSPCLEAFDFEAELRIVISTQCRDEVPDALREAVAAHPRRAGTDTPVEP